jgi:hypothetical protein
MQTNRLEMAVTYLSIEETKTNSSIVVEPRKYKIL